MIKLNNPQMIEFFSGTGTVSRVFRSYGWQSTTVDINSKFNPTICKDILKIEKHDLPANPSFLWFSPDCTTLSRAGKSSHWRKIVNKYRSYTYIPITPEAKNALRMLQKVVEIISWFPDVPFVIENPVGRIQHTAEMKNIGHYRYFVNYADFGFSYSKETYLFSNVWLPFPTKKYKLFAPGLRTINSKVQRSMVPAGLAYTIYKYVYHGKN